MDTLGRATRTRDAHAPTRAVAEAATATEAAADAEAEAATETWRLPREDEETARTLVDLGARGVGGFTTWGIDADGVWARRELAQRTLRDVRDAMAWREAIALVH